MGFVEIAYELYNMAQNRFKAYRSISILHGCSSIR